MAVVAGLASAALPALLAAEQDAPGPVSFTRPGLVQAHRGAGVLAPENTIAAFELGWKLGAIPESDVRTTNDGVFVAFHDSNFARVVHDCPPELAKKGVKDVSFAELQKLEVGAEGKSGRFERRHVSSMEEIFAVMKGHPERGLYLDIKDVNLPKLAELVKAAGVGPQVILASTDLKVIHAWKQSVPDGVTLHWMGGTEDALKTRLEALRKENFRDITQLQIHIRYSKGELGQPAVMTPSEDFLRSVAAELKPRGILFQALPWGISDAATYRHLLEFGIQSFATDHPDVVLPVMAEARLDEASPAR